MCRPGSLALRLAVVSSLSSDACFPGSARTSSPPPNRLPGHCLAATVLDATLRLQYSDNSRSLASAPLCVQILDSEEVDRSQTPR